MTPEEKIAQLEARVNDIERKISTIQHAMGEIDSRTSQLQIIGMGNSI